MRIRKEEKVTSTKTTEVAFGSIVAGAICGFFLGPVAGLAAAAAGFCCGYPVAKREAEEEASKLIDHKLLSAELYEAIENGEGMFRVETELKNIHPGQPILGKLLIGDRLKKETTYYLEE